MRSRGTIKHRIIKHRTISLQRFNQCRPNYLRSRRNNTLVCSNIIRKNQYRW